MELILMSHRKIAAVAVLAMGVMFCTHAATQALGKTAIGNELSSLNLSQDRPVSSQMIQFAQQAGWSLLWEAQEYTSPISIQISGSPEEVVTYFLEGANNAGVKLTGVIRRNIKTIHITE
jgi:hypothetical protein